MRRKKVEIAIFLLLISASLCTAEEEKKAAAQQEVKDFSFVQYQEGGGQKWKMSGRSAEVLDNRVNIEHLSALSFGEGTTLKLKANEGIFDKGENIVNLSNNVIMASTDGTKLTTDHLVWNAETKNDGTDYIKILGREPSPERQGPQARRKSGNQVPHGDHQGPLSFNLCWLESPSNIRVRTVQVMPRLGTPSGLPVTES